jgi:filamentous hemagglutinin
MNHNISFKALIVALSLSCCFIGSGTAEAQLKPAGTTSTTLKTAPNGVPVVDIAAPNASGLSNNQYTDYNVASQGLILDNQNNTKIQVQSQLGGAVANNPNLGSGPEASVILNQVTSTNRSVLAGYTEVVGGTADVIVANPNGITCSGCGFINISNITLTTGLPVIANGGAGALTGFNVNTGDILITGQGMDASTTNYIALFARSIAIQGQINAQYLDVVAGANTIDYASKGVTAQAATGTAPTMAIDSSALGGMYAGRIRLIATEAGVGVRMLGDVSTGAGDFTLTASGQVDLENHITTKGNIEITSSDSSAADSIKVSDAVLLSQNVLSLTATSGNIHLIGSLLNSQGDMTLQSATLTDEADSYVININGSNGSCILDSSSNCQNFNNQRYAAGVLTLTQTGAATLNGTTLATAGALNMIAGTLGIGASENIESTAGNVTLTGSSLNNAGVVSSAAGDLTANANDSLTNTGTLYSSNDMTLNVLNTLTNSNNILAGHDLTISRTGTGGTTGALEINNNTTSGIIQAVNLFTIEGVSGDHKVNLDGNTGDLLANAFNFDMQNLTNSNIIQGTGASTISVSNTLQNNSTGNINLGTTSAGSGTINAGTITDNNIIESAGALNLNIGTSLNTAAAASPAPAGRIISAGDLTIRGLTASNYTINNSGIIQSVSGTLDIAGYGGGSAVNINNGAGVTAALYEGHTINWNANSISFTGNGVKADNDLTIAANSLNLTNSSAYVMAGDAGTLTIGSLTVDGAMFGTNSLTVNSPSITVGSTGALASTGTLQVNLTGSSGSLDNSGALYAGSQLNINVNSGNVATNYNGTFTNEASGTVNSAGNAFFGVNTFNNVSPNFNIAENAEINANTFNNNIPGTFVITWDYLLNTTCIATPSTCFVPDQGTGLTSADPDLSLLPDGAQDSRAGAQADGHNTTSGGLQVDNWQLVNLSGAAIGGAYSDDTEHVAGVPTDETQRYLATFSVQEQYVGAAPTSANRPNMIVGGTLTIENFQTATNRGGDISAPTINISTTKGGATFTNDDLSLQKQNWEAWWDEYSPCADRTVDSCSTWNQRSYDKWITSTQTTSSFGAGIYATNLNTGGFSLVQDGSSQVYNITSKTAPTTGAGTVVSNPSTNSISFGGITVSLPTNPNGLFITNPNSAFGPLIETNPQYAVGSTFLGPNYMIQNYGLDPSTVERQLGDANYDAQLITQQLVNLGASQLLGTTNQAAALQQLMDNGVSQGKSMGLTIGVPPTAAQLASLKSNMVWLVDTVVDGQHVLAPMVYLSTTTKSQIASGAVIQTTNANMQLTSLTNNGGTISGSNTLNVTTQGDITNTSGTITGGNVSLTSTGGNIVNQTNADFSNGQNLAKTATISSTGDLALSANQNIVNTGAQLTAGGNANLNAGGNIDFNTIQDIQSTGYTSSSHSSFGSSTTTSTTTSVTNVGSGLTVGGNLASNSGGDTTLVNANVNVTGNGAMTAGGNLNILDAQNTVSTATSTSGSGLGVGGGIYGTQTTTDTDLKGTSAGSTVHIGGNGSLTAGGDVTLRGSNAGASGNLDVNATNVNVLAGQNTDVSTHTQTTTTFGKVDGGSSSNTSGSSSGATAGTDNSNGATASADANAGANAGNSDSGGVTLAETTTTTANHDQSTAVGSSLSSGGNMTVNASNNVNLVGSNVNAGGDASVNAKNVNVMAAQNTDTTSTSTTDTKIGLYGSSNNTASANADANANAQQGAMGNPSASADANAGAQANSDNTLNLASTEHSTDTTADITHTGSAITSGGNLTVNAQNNLNVNGSFLAAGGDATVNATNMSFTAAQDSHTETKTDSTTTMGLYASAGASANADANAGAAGITGSAGASAGADANAGVGLVGSNTTTGSVNGSTTAQTSSITAGGNLTRNASGDITDQGTQISAGGNFSQNSATWESQAAQNTTFSSGTSNTNTAKLGLYADANASASASASTVSGTSNNSGASASVGLEASYSGAKSSQSSTSSNAVVSNIHAGGNVNTTTTGAASLEGTNMSSGGDMNLNAGSLNYKAAQNTASSTTGSTTTNADLQVGIDATKAVNLNASANYDNSNSSNSSTTAVAGGMTSGGNLHVNTGGDANFEGTNIAAGGSAGVNAGGNVNFAAAHNTSTSSSNDLNAGGSISLSKSKDSSGAGVNASAGYTTSTSNENDAVAGSITSGNGLSVTAGKNATFEGTNLSSGGDTNVAAGGNTSFNAAQSTSSSSGYNVGGSLSMSGGTSKTTDATKGDSTQKTTSAGINVNGGYNNSSSTTQAASNINSGGKVNISSGNDTNLQGTNIASAGTTSLNAGHDVNFTAATNTSSSIGVSGSLGASTTKTTTTPAAAGSKPTTKTENDGNASFDINGGTSTTQTGGSIKAGNIAINSGNDTTLVGTQTQSAGTTTVNAGGNVNLNAATSTNVSGGLGVSAGSTSTGVTQAGISGGSSSQSTNMASGGDLTINSGGKTAMQGSQLSSDSATTVNAKGGTDQSSTTSGNGTLTMSNAGASLSTQQTKIISNGLTKGVASASPQLQSSLSGILNNPNLSVTDKFKQLTAAVTNDPTLSQADKTTMLATLAAQQKSLGSSGQ